MFEIFDENSDYHHVCIVRSLGQLEAEHHSASRETESFGNKIEHNMSTYL
jgi:hypothetical protein